MLLSATCRAHWGRSCSSCDLWHIKANTDDHRIYRVLRPYAAYHYHLQSTKSSHSRVDLVRLGLIQYDQYMGGWCCRRWQEWKISNFVDFLVKISSFLYKLMWCINALWQQMPEDRWESRDKRQQICKKWHFLWLFLRVLWELRYSSNFRRLFTIAGEFLPSPAIVGHGWRLWLATYCLTQILKNH